MTYAELKEIIEKNHVPEDVRLMSNSGWELCATPMDGILWNPEENVIHFIQTAAMMDQKEYGGNWVILSPIFMEHD